MEKEGWQVKNEKLNRNKIHWQYKFPSLTEGEPDGSSVDSAEVISID